MKLSLFKSWFKKKTAVDDEYAADISSINENLEKSLGFKLDDMKQVLKDARKYSQEERILSNLPNNLNDRLLHNLKMGLFWALGKEPMPNVFPYHRDTIPGDFRRWTEELEHDPWLNEPLTAEEEEIMSEAEFWCDLEEYVNERMKRDSSFAEKFKEAKNRVYRRRSEYNSMSWFKKTISGELGDDD